ncbi:MAG: response regulator, partial [Oscillatoriales cyanobacterium]
ESAITKAEYSMPDLILLDVLMPPGIDGFETCQRLKANDSTKDIPVIFMTALDETENKVKGFDLGAVDYVTKPRADAAGNCRSPTSSSQPATTS